MHTIGEIDTAAREFVARQVEPNEWNGCYAFIFVECLGDEVLMVEAWQRDEACERVRDESYILEKPEYWLVDAAHYYGVEPCFQEVALLTAAIAREKRQRERQNDLVAAYVVQY